MKEIITEVENYFEEKFLALEALIKSHPAAAAGTTLTTGPTGAPVATIAPVATTTVPVGTPVADANANSGAAPVVLALPK